MKILCGDDILQVLIGCDGVNSVVANWLGLSAPIHSGRAAVRGLSVFPQGHGMKQEINQFVDVGKRAGLIPLNDKEVYWFLTCPEGQLQLLFTSFFCHFSPIHQFSLNHWQEKTWPEIQN